MTENTARLMFEKSEFSKDRNIEKITEYENGFVIAAPKGKNNHDCTFYLAKSNGIISLYFPPRDNNKIGDLVERK